MAKNLNRNPNKGFVSEINKALNATQQAAKKQFTYASAVVAPVASPQNTPRRLAANSAVAKPKSNIAQEATKVAAKRRSGLR